MKYPSRYSGDKLVTAAQYITELICEKKAKVDGKDLHYRFWLNKEWEKFYKGQIGTAHKLLKKYDAKAIIRALKNPKTRNTYSLRAPYLLPVIKLAKQELERKKSLLCAYSGLPNMDIYRYDLNKEWEKFYKSQIGTANKLLQKYDAVVIIKALGDDKCKNTYSLRAPFLKNVLQKHQKIHDSKTYDLTLEIDRTEKTRFRKTKIAKNTLSRLREIDDGNENFGYKRFR